MRRLLLSLAGACLPVAVGATVLVPIEFREMVGISTVIVHGRVADLRAEWMDGRRSVETLVTVAASEYLKGNLTADSIVVRVPGGQLGRYRTVFVGAPEFQAGDEVVLFLRANRIVGLSQGAFRIVPDAQTGRPTVVSPIVIAANVDVRDSIVRGDSRRQPVSLDTFRDTIRQVLAGGPR